MSYLIRMALKKSDRSLMQRSLNKLKTLFYNKAKTNISNIAVNYLISPLYFLFIYTLLHYFYKIPNYSSKGILSGSMGLSVVSTVFFCYVSAYFQPDLDVPINRPGKGSFPVGHFVLGLPGGKILRFLVWPLNRIWYYIWHPFAALFTHRGAVHWPIVGVWLRVGWLYLVFLFTKNMYQMLGANPGFEFVYFLKWLKAFFPWSKEFGSAGFFLFCFPVFLSDITHSLVDFLESHQKGLPFCNKNHNRGILIRSFRVLRDLPKKTKDHLKDF